MPKRGYELKPAWEDRFNEPDAELLRDALHGMPRRIFDTLRKHLLELPEVSESYAWYGESWRWSIEYRVRDWPPEDNLLVLLIPSPEDLQMAMPIDSDLAKALPMRQLKRAVRDGLDLAAEPFDTRWGVWSVQHATLADELKSLINRKFKYMSRRKAV